MKHTSYNMYRFGTSNLFDMFQSIAVIPTDTHVVPFVASGSLFSLTSEFFWHDSVVFDGFLALTRRFLFLTRCFRLVTFPAPDSESAIFIRLPGLVFFFFFLVKNGIWKVSTIISGKKITHYSSWIILLEIFWCEAVDPSSFIFY